MSNNFDPDRALDVLAYPTARDAAMAAAKEWAESNGGFPPADYFRKWCVVNKRRFSEKSITAEEAALAGYVQFYRSDLYKTKTGQLLERTASQPPSGTKSFSWFRYVAVGMTVLVIVACGIRVFRSVSVVSEQPKTSAVPVVSVVHTNSNQEAQNIIAAAKLQAQAIVDAATLQAQAISNAETRSEAAAQQRADDAAVRSYKAAQRARYKGTPYSKGLR